MNQKMKEYILLSKTERQLLLYDIISNCKVVEIDEIITRLPINKRMIQRDIQDLTNAGLISITYSRKEQGYIHRGAPKFHEEILGKQREHLKKLYRLGTLMKELYNDDPPLWEKQMNKEFGEQKEYFTAKDSYYELFPGSSERTRQRDFETLRRIGLEIHYDSKEHHFVQDFGNGLRDDFAVVKRDGKLFRELSKI